jgi:hypothetical protein
MSGCTSDPVSMDARLIRCRSTPLLLWRLLPYEMNVW